MSPLGTQTCTHWRLTIYFNPLAHSGYARHDGNYHRGAGFCYPLGPGLFRLESLRQHGHVHMPRPKGVGDTAEPEGRLLGCNRAGRRACRAASHETVGDAE
jgi:hypothetical protein